MTKFAHLDALNLRLSRERSRFAVASGKQRELRGVWIAQIEREIDREMEFLGVNYAPLPEMSDDELLAALGIEE